jgi:hypothetical protein
MTPLSVAARNAQVDAAKVLLDHHAEVASTDSNGWTPLHYAARYGSEALVQLLLDHQADIDARDFTGWTTLHLAVSRGHRRIVQLLVDRKADVNSLALSCATPLDEARRQNDDQIAQILRQAGGKQAAFGWRERLFSRKPLSCPGWAPPKPTMPDSAVLGIEVVLRMSLIRTNSPSMVYFIKLPDGTDAFEQRDLIPANYVSGGYFYLLNARPGRYAVVAAACYSGGPTHESWTFFPGNLIAVTDKTVSGGSVAFMGSYSVDVIEDLAEIDDAQRHYATIVADKEGGTVEALPSGVSFARAARLNERPDSAAEEKFLSPLAQDDRADGWAAKVNERPRNLDTP